MAITKEMLDFLFENRVMDSRVWFHENHDKYVELVFDPLKKLVADMMPDMLKIDSRFVSEPRKCLSRINRDTRFTHDKHLYRDNMWFSFRRDRSIYSGLPEFFVDVSQTGVFYGVGAYRMDRKTMDRLRELVRTDDPRYKKALRAYEKQKIFEISGDMYKRSLAPDLPKKKRDWIDRKGIFFMKTDDNFDFIYSPDFPQILVDQFMAMQPVYDFLIYCEATKDAEPNLDMLY